MPTTQQQEFQKHHIVPKFLLKPWTRNDLLSAFYWDRWKNSIRCKSNKGPNGYCYQKNSWTFDSHPLGRNAMETEFFQLLDSDASIAQRILIDQGPQGLDTKQRHDFVRLLISLEVRRTSNVERVHNIPDELNRLPELREIAKHIDETKTIPELWEESFGHSLHDKALLWLPEFILDEKKIDKIANMRWAVCRAQDRSISLVLSDRPLMRTHEHGHPSEVWILPLDPWTVFCASNYPVKLEQDVRPRDVKQINAASANQAEKYVSCVDDQHKHWLGKYLATKSVKD